MRINNATKVCIASVVLIGMAVLATTPAASNSAWPPTGDYLRLTDKAVYHYEALLGSQTHIGTSSEVTGCRETGSESATSHMVQCGECGYVPSTVGAWKSTTTRYTHGRCGSIDLSSTAVTMRVDVQLKLTTAELNTSWSYKLYLMFQDANGDLVPGTAQTSNPFELDADSCSKEESLVWCGHLPQTWNTVGALATGLNAARICAYAEIYKWVPNSAPALNSGTESCHVA